MHTTTRPVITGPLAPWAGELADHLAAEGYVQQSIGDHLRNLRIISAHLASWDLEPAVVDEAWVEQLAARLHRAGRAKRFTPAGCRLVLRFLRSRGVMATPPAPVPSALEEFLDAYRAYLVDDRRLAPRTVPGYVASASWFLAQSCAGNPGRIGELSAAHVGAFVLQVAQVRTPAAVNTVVVGVRSLLRWLHHSGLIERPLAQATPWLARGSASTLPRDLEPGCAEALMATCAPWRRSGARDLAILTVLVRLGLRAGEVAAMQLGDIDWRRAEVCVRGKGGYHDVLPLPVDVGDVLAGYLRVRVDDGGHPQVFVRARAPHGALSMSGVRAVVRQACERAGMADTGTHRLRHGTATDLLRHGAGLAEIGQVLRHHHLQTTAYYAKVDLDALASLARPWPGAER